MKNSRLFSVNSGNVFSVYVNDLILKRIHMKNFVLFLAAVLMVALFIITFILFPADIPVHVILGIAILVAVGGIVLMRKRERTA